MSQQQTVRDAMVPEPTTLGVAASAQDAGRCLERDDVRAVFVVDDDGRLVGVLSRAVLQRRLAEDEPPEYDPDPGSVLL